MDSFHYMAYIITNYNNRFKMKHLKYLALLAFAVLAGFTSCSDDDEWNTTGGGKVEMESSDRAFILNEGSMNKNNSNIIYFDWASGKVNPTCVFTQQNGRQLGDTGNDIITVDGNKIVVAVNVSNYITLLNGYGVQTDSISFAKKHAALGQVRSVDEENGMLYVTSYGGYVSRIRIVGDKLQFVDSLKVGDRPEDVVAHDGKLYVTLQGQNYNDNRLAVVNSDFKTITYSTIMQDPAKVYEDGDNIYVTGFGASYDNPWGVYSTTTGKYTQLGNASAVDVSNGVVYCANSVTNRTTYATTTTMYTYDAKTGATNKDFFKNAPAELASTSVYSISVNPYDGRIYVATSDYMTDGKVYVFNAQGNYEREFSSYGLNPHKIVFLK